MLDSQTPRGVAAHWRRRAPNGVFCLSCGVPQGLHLTLRWRRVRWCFNTFDRQICHYGEHLCNDYCSMRFQISAPASTCCPILFCWTGLTGGWITPLECILKIRVYPYVLIALVVVISFVLNNGNNLKQCQKVGKFADIMLKGLATTCQYRWFSPKCLSVVGRCFIWRAGSICWWYDATWSSLWNVA